MVNVMVRSVGSGSGGSCNSIEAGCSFPERYCLTLSSSRYYFSTPGNVLDVRAKVKNERKYDLMKPHEETSTHSTKSQDF